MKNWIKILWFKLRGYSKVKSIDYGKDNDLSWIVEGHHKKGIMYITKSEEYKGRERRMSEEKIRNYIQHFQVGNMSLRDILTELFQKDDKLESQSKKIDELEGELVTAKKTIELAKECLEDRMSLDDIDKLLKKEGEEG